MTADPWTDRFFYMAVHTYLVEKSQTKTIEIYSVDYSGNGGALLEHTFKTSPGAVPKNLLKYKDILFYILEVKEVGLFSSSVYQLKLKSNLAPVEVYPSVSYQITSIAITFIRNDSEQDCPERCPPSAVCTHRANNVAACVCMEAEPVCEPYTVSVISFFSGFNF